MLEFYTVDLTAIITILFTSVIIYKIIEYMDRDDIQDYSVVLIMSVLLAIMSSIAISYVTIESDNLLTSNYWD